MLFRFLIIWYFLQIKLFQIYFLENASSFSLHRISVWYFLRQWLLWLDLLLTLLLYLIILRLLLLLYYQFRNLLSWLCLLLIFFIVDSKNIRVNWSNSFIYYIIKTFLKHHLWICKYCRVIIIKSILVCLNRCINRFNTNLSKITSLF